MTRYPHFYGSTKLSYFNFLNLYYAHFCKYMIIFFKIFIIWVYTQNIPTTFKLSQNSAFGSIASLVRSPFRCLATALAALFLGRFEFLFIFTLARVLCFGQPTYYSRAF